MSFQKAILHDAAQSVELAHSPATVTPPDGVSIVADSDVVASPTMQQAYQFHASANFLFSVLNDAGERFGQDYVAFVVYCAFLVAAAADTLRDVTARKSRSGYAPGVLSAHSLAAMTGIPRETVRRRCLQLVERGLIERHTGGQFRCRVGSAEAAALVRQFHQVQPFPLK